MKKRKFSNPKFLNPKNTDTEAGFFFSLSFFSDLRSRPEVNDMEVGIINWSEITPEEIVPNESTYSVVLRGKWTVKGVAIREVAIKLVHTGMAKLTNTSYSKIKEEFQDEINILQRAKSHHLAHTVEMLGVVEGRLPKSWFENGEFFPLNDKLSAYGVILAGYPMDLSQYLPATKRINYDPQIFSTKLSIFHDISRSLVDLHLHGIIHGDLKPSNILLDGRNPPVIKICDFGISAILENIASLNTTYRTANGFQGTYRYAAPGNPFPIYVFLSHFNSNDF
jgi:serine/threonine protein kinase